MGASTRWVRAVLGLLAWPALAADITLPGAITISPSGNESGEVAAALKILLGLTVLSLAPAFLIALTSFTRIVIVLSMLRHAIGMPETPPNTVLITLSLFLTLFTMLPVVERVNEEAYAPFVAGKLDVETAFEKGMVPPVMISLPIKVLMFVLIDGWNIVVRSLVASFH